MGGRKGSTPRTWRSALTYTSRPLQSASFLKWSTGSGDMTASIGGYSTEAYPSPTRRETSEDILGSCIDITERVEARELILKERDSEIKRLRGMLPICSSCKKIKDDQGYWSQIEVYVREHSDAEFSHGLCPECLKRLYPEYSDE